MSKRWLAFAGAVCICMILGIAACGQASPQPSATPNLPTPSAGVPSPTVLAASPLPEPTPTPRPALPTATLPPTRVPTENVPSVPGIQVPPGFRITIFASGLDAPRFMTYGPDGTLYVAEMGANRVVALVDNDHNSVAETLIVVADSLIAPSSLAFAPDGSLYVGETTRIARLVLDAATHRAINRSVMIDGLPSVHHTTRTVLFGPNGELYVSIGSSCDLCIERDERRATIMVYSADGKNGRVFARGLRNAVGLALHPLTGELWVTDNGSDLMGDNIPPDTVYIVRDGMDAGWPRCQSGRIVAPEFGGPGACDGVAQPAIELQAHSASLGLTFYTGTQFPSEYHNGLFIAFHGSIYRSVPTGYKVVFVPLDGSQPAGPVRDFATGWLRGTQALSRPVGLAGAPDGSLMISDDKGGRIYRITYSQ